MKKIINSIMVMLFIIGTCVSPYAADYVTKATVLVSMEVGDVFGFYLDPNEEKQELYPMAKTDIERNGELHIHVTANRGNPWSIQAASAGLFKGTQSGYGVPLTITTSVSGNGTTVTNMELKASPNTIYQAGRWEYSVTNFLINGIFKIKDGIISSLEAGKYEGSMILTMTESLR